MNLLSDFEFSIGQIVLATNFPLCRGADPIPACQHAQTQTAPF